MPSHGPRSVPLPGLLLLIGIAACAAIYYPGLHGDFVFDDGPNIVLNGQLQVDEPTLESLRAAAFSSDAGMLKRPISMLSFWANYYTTGLDPFYFKLTNLFIHLLNGLGVFLLARLLMRSLDLNGASTSTAARDGVAIATALIWLLHPLNVTSVLYVVQRMTSLSATFTLFGLVSYLLGRQRLSRGERGLPLILLGLCGFGLLAVLTKENGALLPLYVAVVELTLFRFAGLATGARRKLEVVFLLTVVAPLVAGALFVALDPAWLIQSYEGRDFSLAERLLTEARVLWLYLGWVAIPTRASLGLFHDDIPISHGLFAPASTLFAIAGIVAACAAAIKLRKRAPLVTFAVAWFLVGHALESSVIALELVHEHRNYLPMFGPIFAGVYGVFRASARLAPAARFAIPALFLAALSAVTFGRSLDWSSLHALKLAAVRDHPLSLRANDEAGTALGYFALKNPERAAEVYDEAKGYLERATALDASVVSPMFGLILLDSAAHRPVDEASIERLAARLSHAKMTPVVGVSFRALVDWLTTRVVALPEPLVAKLFEAALGNPTVDHATRANLFSMLSGYYYNVGGDAQAAVSLALAAVEEDSAQPAHHLNLANLAILLGNFEVASREIEAAGQSDKLGRFTADVRRLAASLPPAAAITADPETDVALR
jgi:hypothetical protein